MYASGKFKSGFNASFQFKFFSKSLIVIGVVSNGNSDRSGPSGRVRKPKALKRKELSKQPSMPARKDHAPLACVETFWLQQGPLPPNDWAEAAAATLERLWRHEWHRGRQRREQSGERVFRRTQCRCRVGGFWRVHG